MTLYHPVPERLSSLGLSTPERAGWFLLNMKAQTIDGIEFQPLPRGTMRANLNPIEIDVWGVYGEGWRYTLSKPDMAHGLGFVGLFHGLGFKTFEQAAQEAVVKARNLLHPIQ